MALNGQHMQVWQGAQGLVHPAPAALAALAGAAWWGPSALGWDPVVPVPSEGVSTAVTAYGRGSVPPVHVEPGALSSTPDRARSIVRRVNNAWHAFSDSAPSASTAIQCSAASPQPTSWLTREHVDVLQSYVTAYVPDESAQVVNAVLEVVLGSVAGKQLFDRWSAWVQATLFTLCLQKARKQWQEWRRGPLPVEGLPVPIPALALAPAPPTVTAGSQTELNLRVLGTQTESGPAACTTGMQSDPPQLLSSHSQTELQAAAMVVTAPRTPNREPDPWTVRDLCQRYGQRGFQLLQEHHQLTRDEVCDLFISSCLSLQGARIVYDA
jgi:hypothetical protein